MGANDVKDEVTESVRRLWEWALRQDFRGHDPHNLLESPLLEWLPIPALRLIALQLGRRSPIDLRAVLGVPKAENPKGLALFLSGLLSAREKVAPNWLDHSKGLADRILGLQHENGGWGYPFAWQSRTHYIPKGKPNIVTTSFCTAALVDMYGISKDDRLLNAIEHAVEYMQNCVPCKHEGAAVAFGYAENDPQIVFNASLLGAELLARAANALGREELLDIAGRAAVYVLDHQRSDGAWLYGLERSQTWIDSFHTGFVIESLWTIGDRANDRSIVEAAKRGLRYYLRTFVLSDGSIRYFSDRTYPIDAHAMGQGISMLARRGYTEEAQACAKWAIRTMQSSDGYFYYQKWPRYTNRIPYMRWSNAWMFRGLSDLVCAI